MSPSFSPLRARFLTAAFLILVLFLNSEARARPDEVCTPPATLRAALQERFGSSRILTLTDLYPDERVSFQTEHKGACPGLSAGQFFSAEERPAMALVVLGVGEKKDIRLVVARPALASWILLELDRMDRGATAVVSTGRAGTLTTLPDGTTGRSDRDMVLFSAIDTWQRAYVWNGRAFEKRQTSR